MDRAGDVLERDGGGARLVNDDRPSGPGRRALPGSRPVIGALLITLAALGVIVTVTGADAGPSTHYVVAADDLTAGQVLSSADLTTVAADLPEVLAGRAFRDPASLVGATVLAPIAEGELLQVGSLVRTGGEAGLRELSFSVESDLALGGRLVPGETIDVIATFGTGADADTRAVVTGVQVVDVGDDGTQLDGRFTVITVALGSEADVLALSQAVREGKLVVVRSTGTPAWSEPDGS